jgi:hypothetical protein
MSHRALSQYDLMELVQRYRIPSFRGVFMRDDLPKRSWRIECGILNLDVLEGKGTHWTCWYKRDDVCFYFDSYGLPSPREFYQYIRCDCYHSTYQVQKLGDVICGHLCILMLYLLMVCRIEFHESILTIINGC